MNLSKKISDKDLKQFDNLEKLTNDYFILNLGIGLQYEYSPAGIKYSAPYVEMGEKLWFAFKYELYDLLCNVEEKKPKEWLADIVTGDIRNLATGLISVITAKYDVTIAIALPVAALVIKNGFLNYCSTQSEIVTETVSEILLSNKDFHKKNQISKTKVKKKNKSESTFNKDEKKRKSK